MAAAPVVSSPDPDVQARGGDAAVAEPKGVDPLPRQRVLDKNVVGLGQRPGTADPDIAATIDDEARKASQPSGDQVRRQPLADAARVEAGAGRPGDRSGLVVDLEPLPGGLGVGARRAPRGASSRASRNGTTGLSREAT